MVKYRVNYFGTQPASAVTLSFRVVPTETTAVEGTDYRLPNGTTFTVSKGSSFGYVEVEALNTITGTPLLVLELTGTDKVKTADLYKTIGISFCTLTMEKNIRFNQLQAAAGREIEAGGRRWRFFGGTAYLGLQQDPRMMDLYLRGMQQYGINNGTSRNNNVQLAVYPEAEAEAAQRFGAEAALITSSGYLAAQMAVKQLSGSAQVLYAPATHPALWIQDNLGVSGSFEHWALETVSYINSSLHNDFLVVSNTLNNLLPELYDLSEFKNVNQHKKIHFLLDDSHGIGILPSREWVPAHPGFFCNSGGFTRQRIGHGCRAGSVGCRYHCPFETIVHFSRRLATRSRSNVCIPACGRDL